MRTAITPKLHVAFVMLAAQSSSALLALALGGCVTLTPHVVNGDAAKPKRVVLLPATCSSVDGACSDNYGQGVTGIVETELSSAGLSVVDGTKLVREARTRNEAKASVDVDGAAAIKAEGLAQSGSTFEDLPPADRRALLDEAHADGVVTVKVVVGPRDGMSPVRKNQVLVRLDHGDDGALVWTSRCEAKSGLNPPVDQALAKAARCALSGVLPTTEGDITESWL